MNATHVTQHFTVAETRVTSTGFPNVPNAEQEKNILNTATHMEIVRAILGRKPIRVNSWFRDLQVNRAVGGAPAGEHPDGRAVDFTCAAFGTPLAICKSLVLYADILNYNQLIEEGTWVHISFPPEGKVGKKEVLTMRNGVYTKGLRN